MNNIRKIWFFIFFIFFISKSYAEIITKIEVEGNQMPMRKHLFDTIEAKGIELEIISTHGINRAQVYQVRVFP